jgi:hypothetical protein
VKVWNLSPSRIDIFVAKSKNTIALGDRLQFTILDADIDELLTVATSFVRAKRNVVLKRLMSDGVKRATREIEMAQNMAFQRSGRKQFTRTFDKPADSWTRIVGCFGRQYNDSVSKVKRPIYQRKR